MARFLTGAGPGLADHLAMMLVVRPASGGGREIVLAKYENTKWENDGRTLRAPFPAGDGWVHVAFSVEGSLAQGNLFQQAQARLAVAGKCVSGLLWNDLMGTPFCAGIALGAPGVAVGPTFALTDHKARKATPGTPGPRGHKAKQAPRVRRETRGTKATRRANA